MILIQKLDKEIELFLRDNITYKYNLIETNKIKHIKHNIVHIYNSKIFLTHN